MTLAEGRGRTVAVPLAGVALLTLMAAVALALGAVPIPIRTIPRLLLAGPTGDDVAAVLWAIRLPRIVLAMLVGATLAVAGAALQGIFRNPLADPALIGVSSGASLGAALGLVAVPVLLPDLAPTVVGWALPVIAFAGALLTTMVVLVLAGGGHGRDVVLMLLTGIAVTALAQAGTGLLVTIATDAQLRSLSFWTLGSLGGASWDGLAPAAVAMLAALLLLPREAGNLDLLLLGDAEAAHLGVPVARVTRRIIILASLGVGAAVAVSGLIAFVGLVVPHAIRLALGPSHRTLLPLAALFGAIVLIAADTLARTVAQPIEVPIGVVTALLGAPIFLAMVRRHRQAVVR